MNLLRAVLIPVFGVAGTSLLSFAQSGKQKCPVMPDYVEVSYNHAGGQSKPQLRVQMENLAKQPVRSVILSLSLLDSGGASNAYPGDLVYQDGIDAGKRKLYAWSLSPDAVDIHRTGESVYVKQVAFADGNEWADDGSESCVLTVDYHAR